MTLGWSSWMSPRRVLIISEYVAPVQHIAAIRWTKYAKYLSKECGYDVTILTNRKCFDGGRLDLLPYKYDSSIENDSKWYSTEYIKKSFCQALSNTIFNIGYRALDHIRSVSADTVSSSTSEDSRGKAAADALFKRNIPETIYEMVGRWCGNAIVNAGWRSDLPWDSFDVIISSYSPLWTHDLALKIKKENPNIPWIADFRDAIVNSVRTDTAENRVATRRITEAADVVLGAVDGVQSLLFLNDEPKFAELTNGFDDEDMVGSQIASLDKFRISYTGTLYADSDKKSDLTPLLRVMNELIDSGEMMAEDAEFSYAGMSSYLFRAMAEMYPNVPIVDHGLISRDAAMSLQESSCALVVACWNTTIMRSGRTAKIYEYMGRGLPIIGLIAGDVPHSGMRDFIEECRLGFCYEEADKMTFQGLKNYVLGLYMDWKEMGRPRSARKLSPEVMRYSYRSLVHELDRIIRELCHEQDA